MKEREKIELKTADEILERLRKRGVYPPFIYETLLGGDKNHDRAAVQIFKTICNN